MKRILFLSLLFVSLAATRSNAQTENAIGLRGGFSNGITFQHYIKSGHALEFIGHSRWRGWGLTVLYEVHKPAFDVDGMQWYYGAGGHIGSYRWYKNGPKWFDDEWDGRRTVIGADAILGLEYFFQEIPFQLSLDWKPSFNIIGYSGWWGDEVALSLRYTF